MTTTRRSLRVLGGLQVLEKKLPAGEGIELIRLTPIDKLAVAQADGSVIAHALAGGRVKQHRVLGFGRDPHLTARTVLLKMHFGPWPKGQPWDRGLTLGVFLCVFCRSRSAWAISGRGLRNRKPRCRNKRWHWRTRKWTWKRCSIQALSVFPSHSVPVRPPVARRPTQGPVHLPQLRLAQTPRTPRALPLGQSGQAFVLKTPHPILHRARGIAEQPADLWTGRSLGHQQHPMEPVIIAGFSERANLILQPPKSLFRHQQCAVVPCLHETTNLQHAQLLMTLCIENLFRRFV